MTRIFNIDLVFKELSENCFGKISMNERLARYTSLRIGGPAWFFVRALCLKDIEHVGRIIKEEELPFLIIGGGTNLLISDEGFPGIVVKLQEAFHKVEFIGNAIIRVGAGSKLSTVVRFCAKHGFTGMEFAEGIPGTIGGAIKGNAGTREGEVKDRLIELSGFDLLNGKYYKIGFEDLNFTYRSSGLKESFFITEAKFGLEPDDPLKIAKRIDTIRKKRKESQPLSEKTAGCVFKNPTGNFAGLLIEKSGCKGMAVGGAYVSSIHANFIVNKDGATATDILKLIEKIRKRVFKCFGIELELELQIVPPC